MRLHVVGLPHTQITQDYVWCAYTGKLLRLPLMLAAAGHEVVVYGGEEVDDQTRAACADYVVVHTATDRARWFGGEWDRERVFDRWDANDPCWVDMNAAAIGEIQRRIGPGDGLGIIAGRCQEMLTVAFPNHHALEWGVGYEGVLDRSHRAYESRAWQNYVAGRRGEADGRFYDTVIPNAYDPADFADVPVGGPDDYLLFLGRHTERKGLGVVRELAKEFRVVTAGQDGPLDGCEYRGIVLGAEKAELLARARAVLVPTTYVEPFGGVAVEAMMSGAPVIAVDYGVFPETVIDGVSGYRCATRAEFFAAADNVQKLDRATIRAEAQRRFSLAAVAPRYGTWLDRVATLYGDGWYTR